MTQIGSAVHVNGFPVMVAAMDSTSISFEMPLDFPTISSFSLGSEVILSFSFVGEDSFTDKILQALIQLKKSFI